MRRWVPSRGPHPHRFGDQIVVTSCELVTAEEPTRRPLPCSCPLARTPELMRQKYKDAGGVNEGTDGISTRFAHAALLCLRHGP